jgi:hypothetical protein
VAEKKVSLRETGSSLEFSIQSRFLKAHHQFTKPVPSVTASESAFSRLACCLSKLSAITIPPLRIPGESERTLQPDQKTRPQTNYDNAQTSLITLSVLSGGGSISQGEFTAPSYRMEAAKKKKAALAADSSQ